MTRGKKHHVDFVATKKVKEPTEVAFTTKTVSAHVEPREFERVST
jgi:hypothetical protein